MIDARLLVGWLRQPADPCLRARTSKISRGAQARTLGRGFVTQVRAEREETGKAGNLLASG